jgi:nucleoside-diphosphate-sugar epimerase
LADLVTGLFTILLKGNPEPYNVGAEVETRIGYLADMLAGMYPRTEVIKLPRAASDTYIQSPVHCGHLDISKIRALGWQPTIGIEEGFRRTVASYE